MTNLLVLKETSDTTEWDWFQSDEDPEWLIERHLDKGFTHVAVVKTDVIPPAKDDPGFVNWDLEVGGVETGEELVELFRDNESLELNGVRVTRLGMWWSVTEIRSL